MELAKKTAGGVANLRFVVISFLNTCLGGHFVVERCEETPNICSKNSEQEKPPLIEVCGGSVDHLKLDDEDTERRLRGYFC